MSTSAANTGIGRALARIPSGLFVLTAGVGDAATGILVSWVQQVGFTPPALSVAVRKGRGIEAVIVQHGAFCISVLDETSKHLVGHFARGFEAGKPAFEGVPTAVSALGVPYPTGTAAHLACRLLGVADLSDHTLYVGSVVEGGAGLHKEPLVHTRKNGFSY